jgi:hypothetical protein
MKSSRELNISKENLLSSIEAFLRAIKAIEDNEDVSISFRDYPLPKHVALVIKSKKLGGVKALNGPKKA